MKPAASFSPAAAAQGTISEPEFKIVGNTLHLLNVESSGLDAYRWNAPGEVPTFFVFVENQVHIITLDAGEQGFDQVCTMNETVYVMPVSDEEVKMLGELTERLAGDLDPSMSISQQIGNA